MRAPLSRHASPVETSAIARSVAAPALPALAVAALLVAVLLGATPAHAALPSGTVAGGLFPVRPTRVIDTRPLPFRVGSFATVPGQASIDVSLTGVAGIPPEAIAVVLNVTAVNAGGAGYLTVFPAGATRPVVSSVNFAPGQTVPNLVQIKVGVDGKVVVFNGSTQATDVVVDALGYYAPGGASYLPAVPARFADQSVQGGIPFTEVLQPPSYQGRTIRAVAQNVTIDAPAEEGWVQAYPSADAPSGSSNLNFAKQETVANAVIVGTSAATFNGQPGRGVSFLVRQGVTAARLIIDDVGYFVDPDGTDAGKFVPLDPCRAVDTRPAPDRKGSLTGPLTSGTPVTVELAGVCGLPAAAVIDSVVVNLTAVNATAPAFVRLWAAADPQPGVSTLNVRPASAVANHAVVYGGKNASIRLAVSAGSADVILDVLGYYAS